MCKYNCKTSAHCYAISLCCLDNYIIITPFKPSSSENTITISNVSTKNCTKAKKCANTSKCANIIRWVITLQLPHPTLQHLANRQDTDVLPPDIANIHYAKEIQMSYIQNTEGMQRQSSLQGGSKFKEIKNVLQTYNIQGYRGNTKGGSRERNTGLHSKSKGAHDIDALLSDIADICTLCNKQKETIKLCNVL